MASLSGSLFSQVIDSKQYNLINNWYNWQGGRFITNLNLPKVRATTGRDTGAIHYRLVDSSIYIYTGSQWVKVGGSTLDTTSLSNRINAKVNISDTATMLSPYLRSNVAAATYVPYTGATGDVNLGTNKLQVQGATITGTGGNGHIHMRFQSSTPTGQGNHTTFYADATGLPYYKIDGNTPVKFQKEISLTTTGSSGAATFDGTTLNIPQYSGGGGGSADSSWVSSETGTQPNMLGYLVNSTLGSLPSGWADVTPAASVTFSGKMIVSGGATTTASVTGNTGTQTAYANRIDMDYYPYSKMRYAFTVVPQDKTGTSNGFALHFKSNAITTSFAMRIVFDLTNTADSGKISMGYDYSAAVATSANLSHNAGDTLDIEVVRDHWLIKAKMYNRRTGKQVDTKYYSYGSDFGTGGMAYLGLLGGEQHFLSAKVESYDLKNGAAFTFLGDSQFAGSGATNEDKTFPFQVMRGNKNKIANLSAPGVTLSAIVNSHVPAAIALNNPVIVGAGFNDRSVLSTDTTTFKTRLDAVVDPLIAAGLPVWVTTLVPTGQTSTTLNNNFDLAIINYCAANGIPIIRIDSILKKNGDAFNRIKENYASQDVIHWSDSGQLVAAQKVLQIIGERVPTFFKDTSSPVKIYNLPTGEQNMATLVYDEKTNEVKKMPATTFDIIYNSYKYNGVGTIGQRNAAIHVSGTITTDSLLHVNNAVGLVLQFNGSTGLSASSTAGSNILMTNRATTSGYPLALPIVTGTRQIIFEPLTVKAGSLPTFSGTDVFWAPLGNGTTNFSGQQTTVINTGGNTSVTSSDKSTYIGPDAGRGVTTGDNNLHLTTTNQTASSFATTLRNTIVFGEISDYDFDVTDNDVVIAPNILADNNFYLGGKIMASPLTLTLNAAAISASTNTAGNTFKIRGSAGRGNNNGALTGIYSWDATTSGTNRQTVESLEVGVYNKRVIVPNRFQTSTGADVASANDLTLGNDGNVFTITGTTQINAITTTNWQAGSEIILIFNASVTVKNNTAGGANTAVLLLSGGVDFSATSNDVLKLVYNGTSWFEVSRSVN